jgi:TonB family protein
MGRLEGQENLAVSYVNGEGVKRDNVLGFAWAQIARENGGGEEMQKIIDAIQPHLTEAAKLRVAELQAKFGKEALQKSLLPVRRVARGNADPDCRFAIPAKPDNYYPEGAIHGGVSGSVYLDFTVSPDGRAHHPRVLYGIPAIVFDEAGKAVVRASTFKPKMQDGVAVPCTMRIKVKFLVRPGHKPLEGGDIDDKIAALKANAERGRPQIGAHLRPGARGPAGTVERNGSGGRLVPACGPGGHRAGAIPGRPGHPRRHGLRKGRTQGRGLADARGNRGQPNAQVVLANYLLQRQQAGDVAAALGWLEKASAAGDREGTYRLASLLAAGPEAAARDPQRALDLLAKVMDAVDTDPTAYEVRAAANAALGRFDEARKDQKRALTFANKLGWDAAPQKERLDKYQNNVAWTGDLFAL